MSKATSQADESASADGTADLSASAETDLPAVTSEPGTAIRPTHDDLFELLANRRRRYAMHYLHQRDGETVSLSELSEHIAAWEHGVDAAELDYLERKSVRNSLHQFHLPKLDDAGVVEYDTRTSEVRLRSATGAKAYHDVVREEYPWALVFLAVSTAAVAVYALVFADLLSFLPDVAWAAVFVASFALTSVLYAVVRHNETRPVGPPPEIAK
jgi:hypothetical protein